MSNLGDIIGKQSDPSLELNGKLGLATHGRIWYISIGLDTQTEKSMAFISLRA